MSKIKDSMATSKEQKVIPLIYDTYVAVIKNSVDSKIFRNFYAKVGGKKKDIMRNGDLSCAFFVSSILVLFKLIKNGHGTVRSTVEDLKKSGWKIIKKPKIGSIIVWEKIVFKNGESNMHIGFYVGKNTAISTNSNTGLVYTHHYTFNNKRRIESIFWNNKLS
jgi:hypothetical protein